MDLFFVRIVLTIVLFTAAGSWVPSAAGSELKVLSTIAARPLIDAIASELRRAEGQEIAVSYDSAKALQKRIEADEAFDAVILTAAKAEELMKGRHLAPDSRVDFARVGLGLAKPVGTRSLDIGTPLDFMHALLDAHSIIYASDGASGTEFLNVTQTLGIDVELEPKLRAVPAGEAMERLARREAEIGVQLISEIVGHSGVELAGAFPRGLQRYIILSAGMASRSKQAEETKAFIQALRAPAVMPLIKEKGLEPL